MANVRLSDHDVNAIIDSFKKHFLPADHLWLFGSRADLTRRGGDIDLYIETTETDTKKAIDRETSFVSDLWERIGEQKIDVVLNVLALKGEPLRIYEVARSTGIKLV